jgi:ZIP family zinc transporter
MMIAASYSLVIEGTEPIEGFYGYHSGYRLTAGFLLGIIFIHLTKNLLNTQGDDLQYNSITGQDFKKIILIIFVMTIHSFSEGVGIGVSFGMYFIITSIVFTCLLIYVNI